MSSLAAILAQCMASAVVLWYVGNARPIPFHLEDWACPSEPNIMSRDRNIQAPTKSWIFFFHIL